MRLIDADILYPDSVSIKGDRLCISQSQIANAPTVNVLNKIRAEIENHCGLVKENHCKYCSYCNSVMGVREILEIIDKYKAGQAAL